MIEECVRYFKNNGGYNRAFMRMKAQWKKYGRPAGRILIKNPTDQEREALEGFLGLTAAEEKIEFPMSAFEEALAKTRYSDIDLTALLSAYFSESLVTNKASRQMENEQKEAFFTAVCQKLQENSPENGEGIRWVTAAGEEKKYGYHLILAEYKKSEEEARSLVLNTCKALAYLNKMADKRIRLAVLAARVTANPHYFDRNTAAGKLLIAALTYTHNCEGSQKAEKIAELYHISGIKPDDLSNSTVLYGITLYTETGPHPAYKGFIQEEEPWVVSMLNLGKIIKAECPSKKVFVFENQMVFSQMCESLKGHFPAMMCTSGQVKTASLLVIDMLCAAGCTLYYAGDIDPEGMGIADRMIARNNRQIKPWFFTEEAYAASISSEPISNDRLKQLTQLRDPCLSQLAELVRQKKRSGYQEFLLAAMREDIIMRLERSAACD